jgi:23S rRNA pseudouridine2605 synthase
MKERLQKILARAGIASRRASEELIREGRVTVNGTKAELGMQADPVEDHILVDGRRVAGPEPLRYIALNKPRNVISTVASPDPRPTVRDLVPVEGRLYPVGRLDIESEGLVLLTNDGELANRITHPRYGCEKEYRALVARLPDERQLEAWRKGVVLADEHRTLPAKVRVESTGPRGTWLRIVMKEGRKRQIREIGDQLGLPVLRLLRVRIGTLQLGNLKPREWRDLTKKELDDLRSSVTVRRKTQTGRQSRKNR